MSYAEAEYELVLTPPARRALTEHLPEAVAGAVIEFMTTALVRQSIRVGKPLRGELAGVWSARRGTDRVLHRVRAEPREVIAVRIEHRRKPTARSEEPCGAVRSGRSGGPRHGRVATFRRTQIAKADE